jgi:hypothetical protein
MAAWPWLAFLIQVSARKQRDSNPNILESKPCGGGIGFRHIEKAISDFQRNGFFSRSSVSVRRVFFDALFMSWSIPWADGHGRQKPHGAVFPQRSRQGIANNRLDAMR